MLHEAMTRLTSHGRAEFRNFALTLGIAGAVIGALLLWRQHGTGSYLCIGSGVLILLGLLVPGVLRWPYLVWMGFSVLLGTVVTGVLLTAFYYLFVTPLALVRRLFVHDQLGLRFQPGAKPSYWRPRDPEIADHASFERQY